jgi:hypothetical protein
MASERFNARLVLDGLQKKERYTKTEAQLADACELILLLELNERVSISILQDAAEKMVGSAEIIERGRTRRRELRTKRGLPRPSPSRPAGRG